MQCSLLQVVKTYNIRNIFRNAINACSDVTDEKFPELYKNKNQPRGNISRITIKSARRLMIFVARVYQAHITTDRLRLRSPAKFFNFATYPILEKVFEEMEGFLGEYDSREEVSVKGSSSIEKAQSIQTELVRIKTRIEKAEAVIKDLLKQMKSGKWRIELLLILFCFGLCCFNVVFTPDKGHGKRKVEDDIQSFAAAWLKRQKTG